jgi:hypothetical protein
MTPRSSKGASYLNDEWAKTMDADGYFYYSRKPQFPHRSTTSRSPAITVTPRYLSGNSLTLLQLSVIESSQEF